MIEKVGPKNRHVDIPDGWQRVTSGKVLRGDKFLLCPSYTKWILVDEEDLQDCMMAENFDCLIRPIGKVN